MTDTAAPPETAPAETANAERWLRVTRLASALILVWAVTLNLIAGELIPEVLVIGLVFGALSVFLIHGRRRLGLVTAILAVVALTGNLAQTIDELSHPSSAPAFMLTLLVTVAALVAVISGAAAFWRLDPGSIRPIAYGSAAVFGLGVLVALSAAASIESVEPLDSDVQVVARGVEFDQSRIVVSTGQTGFWLDNQDGIRHTLSIRETGHELDVAALSSDRADFDLAPGTYEVFCAVPGHENMHIDLVVEG